MGFVLTNGDTFISRVSGKIKITYDQSHATVYVTESKAWNELEHLPKQYKQQQYLPKKVDTASYAKPKAKSNSVGQQAPQKTHDPVTVRVADSEWLTQFKKNLILVDETLGSLKDTYSKVYGDLTKVADDLEDISHAMELINANAVKRCYLENEFKLARRKRRECKDAMMLIELVSKFEQGDWGSGKLQAALDSLANRTYTPKSRDDLFK